MRLLLDQMLREEVAEQLRAAGHDVIRVSERGLGRADDAQILARAIQEERILVTIDSDFGDWVTLPLSEHLGVIRVRVHPTTSANVTKLLLPLIRERSPAEFRNHSSSFPRVARGGFGHLQTEILPHRTFPTPAWTARACDYTGAVPRFDVIRSLCAPHEVIAFL